MAQVRMPVGGCGGSSNRSGGGTGRTPGGSRIAPAGLREAEAEFAEPLGGGKIGDSGEGHLPMPQVPGKCLHRREAGLRQPSVPLGPDRLRRVGEVQALDRLTMLPAHVRRLGGLLKYLSSGRRVPPPRPSDVGGLNGHGFS